MFKAVLISSMTAYALGLNLGKKTKTITFKSNSLIKKEIVDDIKEKT